MPEAVKEVWERRELLFELAYRDLRVRYKQTALGLAWALLMPVLMMLIFNQIFTRVAKVETDVPYPLFVYCGLLPWQFLSSSLKSSVESLTRNRLLVTKIYMPREVFPLATIASGLIDFAVASVVLAGLMIYYGIAPTAAILFLPVIVGVQLLFMIGLSLVLSMGHLFYRDVKYVFEVMLTVWMFLTSVVYPLPTTGIWPWISALNPMTPIIDAYRRVLLYGQMPDPAGFAWASLLAVGLCLVAVQWFHESEYLFAENM